MSKQAFEHSEDETDRTSLQKMHALSRRWYERKVSTVTSGLRTFKAARIRRLIKRSVIQAHYYSYFILETVHIEGGTARRQ